MNQGKRLLALAGTLLALALILAVGAVAALADTSQATLTVCPPPGTGCDYDTIQAAVDAADPGDTIHVAQGTYTENLVVDVAVTLEGGYSGPPDWNRDVDMYETIIANGQATTPGDWDGAWVGKPAVISDGAELKMWYDGHDLDDELAVGLATSTDGMTWTKSLFNPVLEGTPGMWDEASGEHGTNVLKEGGVYKMWYEGSDDGGNLRHTGYATSTDGITWNKYAGDPVIQAGPETYDQNTAGHGSVLNEGGTYKRWYHAAGDQGAIIAYATAPDEVTWTKQGPVLLPDPGGWDIHLWGPSVLNLDGTYWMWYAAAGPDYPPSIGVVTSTDGISWTRFLTEPAVFVGEPIGDPVVISDSGKLKMWFSHYGPGTIDYAESDDGINWTVYPGNPVLEPGEFANWGGRPVTLDYGSDGVVLDGFIITGGDTWAGGGLAVANDGTALVDNCTIAGNRGEFWGGGVWVTYVDATIRNSTISYNSSNGVAGIEANHDYGLTHLDLLSSTVEHNEGGQIGGMQVWGDQASATVVGSTFYDNISHNNGGGLALNNSASAIISSTVVYSNTADGSGAGISVNEGSSIVVHGAQVYANTAHGGQGGGISGEGGDVHLTDSWVVGNVAEGNEGGGIAVGDGGSFYGENNIIAGNYSGTSGGGLWLIHEGPFQLVNSNVVGNDTAEDGGALSTAYGTLIEITNTLIINNGGNTGIGDRDESGATILLSYCDTYGNSPDGASGVTIARSDCLGTPPEDGLDPLFAGGTMPAGTGPDFAAAWLAYDYQLQDTSPAIDAGTADGAPAGDIAGTPRDANPDMGAYEWAEQLHTVYLPIVLRNHKAQMPCAAENDAGERRCRRSPAHWSPMAAGRCVACRPPRVSENP